MMKRCSTNYLLLLGAVLASVLSCKKTNPPAPEVQFPLTVKAAAILSQGSVRLFTHEGEVIDETTIAQFIAGAFSEGFLETLGPRGYGSLPRKHDPFCNLR